MRFNCGTGPFLSQRALGVIKGCCAFRKKEDCPHSDKAFGLSTWTSTPVNIRRVVLFFLKLVVKLDCFSAGKRVGMDMAC